MSLVECPYVEGAKYGLELGQGTILDEAFKASSKLEVIVLKLLEPTTISPVLKITVDRSDQETIIPAGSTLILKLFDSRFAIDLRKFHDVPDLTAALANEYSQFFQRQSKTFEEWDAERIELENEDKELSPLEKEAHLDTQLRSYYQSETKVYEKLAYLQGRDIPKFFGPTRFIIDSTSHRSLKADVPGILLEYVEGPTLEELPPGLFHGPIATSALDIVSALSDNEIINKDVSFDNFIVPPSGGGRPVVMIDFAQCEIRGKESDQEWYDKKASHDEEGAVGCPLKEKFGWGYQPSRKYVIRA